MTAFMTIVLVPGALSHLVIVSAVTIHGSVWILDIERSSPLNPNVKTTKTRNESERSRCPLMGARCFSGQASDTNCCCHGALFGPP
jgi:hypothetical protein